MSEQIKTSFTGSAGNDKPFVAITGLTMAEREHVKACYEEMSPNTPCGALAGIKEMDDGSIRVLFEEYTSAGMMEGFIRGGLLVRNGLSEASGRLAPRTH
jgi:hypothetical protein